MNTYINISLFIFDKHPEYNYGRLFTTNKLAKLDLHLDISYEQAQQELAKLMLRTGKMPEIIGKNEPGCTMYTLSAFLG